MMLHLLLTLIKKILGIQDSVIITEEFQNAFQEIENSNKNFFVTGHAGSGKSTFIDYFRKNTKKKVVILAPTGLAAINIKGQTIHSFFRFPPRMITKEIIKKKRYSGRLYKQVDTIVIDEASMVRADLLDGIDLFLRKFGRNKNLPFGGTQIILVGDPFQLPPVVTNSEAHILKKTYESPYFFSANAYRNGKFAMRKFTKIFRQEDKDFISFLNRIRKNNISASTLKPINNRIKKAASIFNLKKAVTLATTNKVVNEINQTELENINNREFVYKAKVEGKFPTKNGYLPADLELSLKKGARVMFTKNGGKWVNGTLGRVHSLSEETIKVKIDDSGELVTVPKEEWEYVKYEYDEYYNSVNAEVLGKLIQYPLRLAWAITIHKSQGMTFSRVNIDYSKSPFAHGQTYVALSRCKSLDGLTISKEIFPNDVIVDKRVLEFANQDKDL